MKVLVVKMLNTQAELRYASNKRGPLMEQLKAWEAVRGENQFAWRLWDGGWVMGSEDAGMHIVMAEGHGATILIGY